jgi:hypothetical protein
MSNDISRQVSIRSAITRNEQRLHLKSPSKDRLSDPGFFTFIIDPNSSFA